MRCRPRRVAHNGEQHGDDYQEEERAAPGRQHITRLEAVQADGEFAWMYKGKTYVSKVISIVCPMCGALAVVELPEAIKAKQPDGTTHVCHPIPGGCNHGFSM